MGIADSPLRDRVIFVQGAPRSGTTWLVALLATHPQIAGVEAESHLFDFGLDRLFDNLEGRDPHRRGLDSYLEREQLVGLARELSDGVLMAMRSHVSGSVKPELVVEKTPSQFDDSALDLQRKLECFPDAWYLHIVRDGDAVARSLMRAPWVADRSLEGGVRRWRASVDSIRRCLSDHPRYREVRYEDLRADPPGQMRDVFEWLGARADAKTLETVGLVSREQFSDLGAVPAAPAAHQPSTLVRHARLGIRRGRAALSSMRRPGSRDGAAGGEAFGLGFAFARALRQRDEDALRSLTANRVELVYRSPEGDVSERGDDARDVLIGIAQELFVRRFVGEWWASAPAQPSEWWTSAPGHRFWTIFFSALTGEGRRVDLAFGLWVEDDLVIRLVVLSTGPLSGRPMSARQAPAEADARDV